MEAKKTYLNDQLIVWFNQGNKHQIRGVGGQGQPMVQAGLRRLQGKPDFCIHPGYPGVGQTCQGHSEQGD